MNVFTATDVWVTRNERDILRGVNLTVDDGELVALVGPNGAGKSTLLSVLSHDLVPSRGVVTLRGRALPDWTTADLALTRAVLPQSVTVAFPFTVVDVVRMGRAPYYRRAEAARDDEVVAEAMDEMGIGDLAERRHPSLSGGEQARVAMARVLAQAAPVMLLDEPTAALDLKYQELVLQALTRRVAAGATAVVVLHDLSLAEAGHRRWRGEGRYGGEASVLGAPIHEARRIEQRVDLVERLLDVEQDSNRLLAVTNDHAGISCLGECGCLLKASDNLIEELPYGSIRSLWRHGIVLFS